MLSRLLLNHYEAAAVILLAIGLMNLLLQKNLIKKIIGLNITDTAVYLFLAAKGYVSGRAAPILFRDESGDWVSTVSAYVNPIPAGLVLTGIVVSVSVTAFALALTLRLYENYGTLDMDKALFRMALLKQQKQQQQREHRDNEPGPAGQKQAADEGLNDDFSLDLIDEKLLGENFLEELKRLMGDAP